MMIKSRYMRITKLKVELETESQRLRGRACGQRLTRALPKGQHKRKENHSHHSYRTQTGLYRLKATFISLRASFRHYQQDEWDYTISISHCSWEAGSSPNVQTPDRYYRHRIDTGHVVSATMNSHLLVNWYALVLWWFYLYTSFWYDT